LLRELGVRSRDGSAHGDHCSVHHRVSRSDDHDVTQPRQRFICIHPFSFPLARSPLSARSFLGHYPSLSTPPLPVTQRGIGDSPGHWAESLRSTQHKRHRVALSQSSAYLTYLMRMKLGSSTLTAGMLLICCTSSRKALVRVAPFLTRRSFWDESLL
jgi:hypothetical protein